MLMNKNLISSALLLCGAKLCLADDEPTMSWGEVISNFTTCASEGAHKLSYYLSSDSALLVLPSNNETLIDMASAENEVYLNCLDALAAYDIEFYTDLNTLSLAIEGLDVSFDDLTDSENDEEATLLPIIEEDPADDFGTDAANYTDTEIDDAVELEKRVTLYASLGIEGYWNKNCDHRGYDVDTGTRDCQNMASTSYMKSFNGFNYMYCWAARIAVYPHHNCSGGASYYTIGVRSWLGCKNRNTYSWEQFGIYLPITPQCKRT